MRSGSIWAGSESGDKFLLRRGKLNGDRAGRRPYRESGEAWEGRSVDPITTKNWSWATARSWKRQGRIFPEILQREYGPADT